MVRIPDSRPSHLPPSSNQPPSGAPAPFELKKSEGVEGIPALGGKPEDYPGAAAQQAIKDYLALYNQFKSLKPPIDPKTAIDIGTKLHTLYKDMVAAGKDPKNFDPKTIQQYQWPKAVAWIKYAMDIFDDREQEPNFFIYIKNGMDTGLTELQIDHPH